MKVRKKSQEQQKIKNQPHLTNTQTSSEALDVILRRIRDKLPAVEALLASHQDTRLSDHVARIGQSNATSFQSDQDFVAEMVSYTDTILGPDIAAAMGADLRDRPQVLTANHHGLDTFAQSTQTNLLFSMRKRMSGEPSATVPVLACGSVPMNNLTYPRGLLVYAGDNGDGRNDLIKLPIFPDSFKRKLVSVVGPFTAEMLQRAGGRVSKLADAGVLAPSLEAALKLALQDFEKIDSTFTRHSMQATLANHSLWKRLFQDSSDQSELVYVELELIASRLLQKDLLDKTTICHQLLFDPDLRKQLIDELNGQRGCWQYTDVSKQVNQKLDLESPPPSVTASGLGTMFFWGVDSKGRKVSLFVEENDQGSGVNLTGTSDSGQAFSIPFVPAEIIRGLTEGRLLPSIFTSYLLISIARGVGCVGGYYQADYLPVMRNAVHKVLKNSIGKAAGIFAGEGQGHTGKGGTGERPVSDLYLSGMQAICLEADDQLVPAGPIELIASGGLTAEQFEKLGRVTVGQSHLASLSDTINDVMPHDSDLNQFHGDLMKLVSEAIKGDLVIISID